MSPAGEPVGRGGGTAARVAGPPRNRWRPALALLPLLCLPPAAAGQDAVSAEDAAVVGDPQIVSLDFEGNDAFADGVLAAAIETRSSRCRNFVFQILLLCPLTSWSVVEEEAYLDEGQLPADLLRLRVFYRRRGYREVQVDTAVTRLDGQVEVAFLIDEGRPTRIDTLRLEGLEGALDPEEVRGEIGIGSGDPFDRLRLEAAKTFIRSRLINRGYVNAVVLEETALPAGGGARVTLEVQPGVRARVGEIRIQGARGIGERVVREFLTIEEGDYYSEERIQESQRALFELGAVRFASIARPGSVGPADSTVALEVRITEAETRTVRVGGGVSTSRCFQTEARFTHRNFFGSARRFQVTGRLANLLAGEFTGSFPCPDAGDSRVYRELNYLLQGDFEQPYFLSSRNSFRASLFLERETFPDIFVRNSRGAEAAVTRRLRPRMPATLAYRPELTSFDEQSADVFFCVNFGFCQPEDIAVLEEAQWLSPVSLSWRYDRTNAPFSATRGWYASADAEVASLLTGSDYDYARLTLEAADFEEVRPGLVLAGRIRAGIVQPTGAVFDLDGEPEDQVVHPRKRFFAGGAQSIRGFAQNLLGPTVLLLDAERVLGPDAPCENQTLEDCAEELATGGQDPTRFFDERPVGGDAAFEASLEARKSLGPTIGVVGFVDAGQVWPRIDELEWPVLTPGIGLRYSSPVGPLRLDLAYNPTGVQRLPVVVQLVSDEIIRLDDRVPFRRFTFDDPGALQETWRRLQLHLSIGEAF